MRHTTQLCEVSGTVALTVPPELLKALDLRVGSMVGLAVDEGRLVVEPGSAQPHYTMAELLAQGGYTRELPSEEREWVDAPRSGRELI